MTRWNQYRFVEGGICAINGFEAAGIHCGILENPAKKEEKCRKFVFLYTGYLVCYLIPMFF